MEDSRDSHLSFEAWESASVIRKYQQNFKEEAAGGDYEMPENESQNKAVGTAEESIKALCRVCSNRGLISISMPMSKGLKYRNEGGPSQFKRPIYEIIAEISSLSVSRNFCMYSYEKNLFTKTLKLWNQVEEFVDPLTASGFRGFYGRKILSLWDIISELLKINVKRILRSSDIWFNI